MTPFNKILKKQDNLQRQKVNQWLPGDGGRGRREGLQRSMRKLLRTGTFITLIVMMILQAYGYVKTYQTVHFKYRLFVGI